MHYNRGRITVKTPGDRQTQPCSTTTWISQHHKGQTNLDFNEVRDDGVAVASPGPYANHLHLALDR